MVLGYFIQGLSKFSDTFHRVGKGEERIGL
jgi:hypothetical protein